MINKEVKCSSPSWYPKRRAELSPQDNHKDSETCDVMEIYYKSQTMNVNEMPSHIADKRLFLKHKMLKLVQEGIRGADRREHGSIAVGKGKLHD